MLATAKHFLGYAMADGGRNIGAVQLGERELLEVYARPFGAAIAEAGLESVMSAYSDLNGEPRPRHDASSPTCSGAHSASAA